MGEVVGVEISPHMAARARQRIAAHGWDNVRVIEAAAQSTTLPGLFNAALLFAAHEVLTSPPALDTLLAGMQPGARVATFGAKLSTHRARRWLRPLFVLVSRKLLPVSPPIDRTPWRLLEARLEWFEVEEHLVGSLYLAWGAVAVSPPPRQSCEPSEYLVTR